MDYTFNVPIEDTTITVGLNLGDLALKLCYDQDALMGIFNDTGLSILRGDVTGLEFGNPKVFKAILENGLMRHCSDIDIIEVGRRLNAKTMPVVLRAVMAALTGVMPEPEHVEEGLKQTVTETDADPFAPEPESSSNSVPVAGI